MNRPSQPGSGDACAVYLVLETSLDIGDAVLHMGAEGHVRRYLSPMRNVEVTEWKLLLASGSSADRAVQSVVARLEREGDELMMKVGALVALDEGSEVAVVMTQDLNTDMTDLGFELNADLVRWLARIGSSLSVDQAVY